MSKNNEVRLIGHVGKNPFHSEKDNSTFSAFDIATSNGYRDKKTKEYVNKDPDWHNIVCYEHVAKSVKKQAISSGKEVLVIGKLTNVEWTDENGKKHSGSRIVAETVKVFAKNTDNESADEE